MKNKDKRKRRNNDELKYKSHAKLFTHTNTAAHSPPLSARPTATAHSGRQEKSPASPARYSDGVDSITAPNGDNMRQLRGGGKPTDGSHDRHSLRVRVCSEWVGEATE